ncbi:MAG TPA: DUF2231 domain-containing protein [Polyangia bacterium]|nr:DUF2231 domain-containing protein [Polyangia bacterium]
MKSRVVVAGHALHPMLIVFPLGLLATSVVWDVCALATHAPRWALISFWTIVAGVVGALLAAVPGFVDWLGIPRGTRARRLGTYHLVINLAVVALFIVSLAGRWATPGGYEAAGAGCMIVGWIGVALAVVSSWLGGELVETLGVSVREGANPDAPSSLSSRSHGVPAHRGV